MKQRDIWIALLLTVLLAGVANAMIFEPDAQADQENSVVVWLHGRNGTGPKLEASLQFTGTEAVYLTSPDGSWHAGDCCEPAISTRWWLSDVNRVQREVQRWIDQGYEVWLGGQSNGAMLALRYVCYHDDIAGIISISGALRDDCDPNPLVPVVAVHGGQDTTVPLDVDGYGLFDSVILVYPDGGHGQRELPPGVADLAWGLIDADG